jgi:hypothetical protein
MKFVVEPQFAGGRPFSDGLAPVATAEPPPPADRRSRWKWLRDATFRWGYIDRSGKVVVRYQFEDAWLFSEGLAPVCVDGKWGYIHASGVVVIQPQYEYAWPFSEGKGRVLVGERDVYVDRGKRLIRVGQKHGYIDKNGKMAIEPRYDAAWEFSKGLARVGVGDREGYIDHEGTYVWEPTD